MNNREYSEFLVKSLARAVLKKHCSASMPEQEKDLFLKGYMESFLISLVQEVPELERNILDRIKYILEHK